MFIFKANNLTKDWNGVPLFKNVDLELKEGEHAALFGRNGVGKTTLLNGLLDKIEFDAGSVKRFVPANQWGLLEQEPLVSPHITAMEFVQSVSRERYQLKKELERIQEQPEFDMDTYSEVYNQFLDLDGYQLQPEAEAALHQVNLDQAVWNSMYQQLSGGQKTRVQLARLILERPDCIVMDEPTNHLDQETIEWLEGWIAGYSGAVLYVSHDRLFLDRTADAIYELNADGCKRYEGGYTAYREQKEVEWKTQEAQYRKQEQQRKELMQTIQNYQKWFHQAHKAAGQDDFARAKAKKNVSRFKAKEKELERLDQKKVEKPESDKKVNFRLDNGNFSAKRFLHVEDMSFSYVKETSLFSGLNMSVYRGDRVGVIGPNGSGKSTLLKLMTGQIPPGHGIIKQNPQTKIGYFAQELDNLDNDTSILDSMLELPGMTQSEARTILGCFLFSRETVFKKISALSMGEKCRVAFIRLYFSDANLLVLDEPTNFLDVDTREIVEDVLMAYPGALIVVSHDRYLIRKIANRILDLGETHLVDYEGTFDEYDIHLKNPDRVPEKVRELKLRLTQLMGKEASTDEEQEQILQEIRTINQTLDEL
ncbi:ribosomal protection-like ABC-F family protein [Virgibacillus siamensis]|uniref:ribosomal protection-like ABC-F family protein n=1 Tax=Virgibacillus siamensis TaxID=480071 RepID=UPI0009863561|nr:ABC-F type ribosomal protection protein [Virgibacillus siamensis]